MNKVVLLLYILLSLCGGIQAQYNNLLHKTYAERRAYMGNYYLSELSGTYPDSLAALKLIHDIAEIAQKGSDADLNAEAALMLLNYQANRHVVPEQQLIVRIDSFALAAKEKEVWWLKARMESLGGLVCSRHGYNYEMAFQYYERMYNTIQQLSKDEFPEKQICYYQIGHTYYYFSDLQNTIKYMKEGIGEAVSIPGVQCFTVQMLNTTGLCYQEIGLIDSAEMFFQMAVKEVTRDKVDSLWLSILKGNLGYNRFLANRYAEAKPLLEADIAYAIRREDWGLASGSLTVMGAIDLAEGSLAKAEAEMDTARTYIGRSGQYKRLVKLYPLLSKLHSAKGNYKAASLYLDSALIITDSITRQFNALMILRGKQKAELSAKKDLEDEKNLKTLQRNFMVGSIIFLFPVALLLYYLQRKKYQQQQRIKDLELASNQAMLEHATEQLASYTRIVSLKDKLLQEMEQKMDSGDNEELLTQLQQSTILTEEEWIRFRKLFEQVHIGFLARLRQKLPNLSPAETRFMVLAKLEFSNREMAAALGVSAQSIRVTRHRLLKKINLPEDSSLEELVNMI